MAPNKAVFEAFDTVREPVVAFVTSHIYLTLFTLIAIHFGITQLLKAQNNNTPSKSGSPLKISEIYIYPIKSLRGTRVDKALATKNGFAYDRTFMLLKATENGYKNMAVSSDPEMTQFFTDISLPSSSDKGSITVTTKIRGQHDTITIPLQPSTSDLEEIEINMHGSPTKAYKMPSQYSTWFTQNFGYPVVLAYLGDNRRDVLFSDLKPSASGIFPTLFKTEAPKITFADCAPYLIVSSTSLADVSSRLPPDSPMDITKFRPNIVISGAAPAWEEDFWGALNLGPIELTCAHNCIRCKSINIDYATGKPGTGESGQVLKKMQKDRRVDGGAKWSPVFGRYSYWSGRGGEKVLGVGDEVVVTKVNRERTTWTWPGLQ